ncbi:helix-turn-helix transcriptional regulator [Actinoplanes friuliensis]|uniref:TrmB family transcriptional regulator n=1 Tax=Actinoplanes friuliensis DSM 7358 TaxID=1246995 RepID=U5W4G7_9ACTN|nr:LuxR C-terminal-related transcriptional regulator [Actinoplanes friuliensis]AGZ43907.1 TrmB family transcriptional regulator [Actinoplanes friuliensis DSM 7358]
MTTVTPPHPLLLSTPAAIDAALANAGREVLVARTGPGEPLRRADHDNLRRGVRYRVLLPESVRAHPAVVLRLGRLVAAGAEIRTVAQVPADVTVVDETVAMMSLDRSAADVAVVHLPAVVDTVVALFARQWEVAAPLTSTDELCARERELLALLSSGYTDESAAARLGVSVRTVRRMMSVIMGRLGARSRFQAGLRAADRGLLMPLR